jgi:hypothetical protein
VFHDSGDSTFEVLSERLARMIVKRSLGRFGLTLDSSPFQRHRLGLSESPLYQLEQPLSPDDGWEVSALPSGAFVDGASPAPAIDPLYEAWAVGSRAQHGHELIGLLPIGRYLFVRSPRPLVTATSVVLGNECVAATANMRVLREHEPYYACVIGPDVSTGPDLSQPLLSLVVLNYVGDASLHGSIFFPFSSPRGSTPASTQDMLLIVPEEGELVMDNLGVFSRERERRAKQAWRDRQAAEFADWCALEL